MNAKQLLIGILTFLGVYIVPTLVLSALGVRGMILFVVAGISFVAQIILTILFFRKNQLTAGFVGIVTIMIQITLNIVSNLWYVQKLTGR